MNKKRIALVLIVIVSIAVVLNFTNVFGFDDFDVNKVNSDAKATDGIGAADKAVNRIWGTAVLIIQILAIAAIVIAGVRYMFASADGKADIKKQTIGLVVGAILVFAASTIVQFIVSVTNQVTMSSVLTIDADGTVHRQSDYDNDGINDWRIQEGKQYPDILIIQKMRESNCLEKWKADHPDDPNIKSLNYMI